MNGNILKVTSLSQIAIFSLNSQTAAHTAWFACSAAIKNMRVHKELSEFHPNM